MVGGQNVGMGRFEEMFSLHNNQKIIERWILTTKTSIQSLK